MFCPKCGVFLNETDLIQRNIKMMGNVPVEYDARCPNCNIEIGKMHWGKFTIDPELAETNYRERPPLREKNLIPPPPELRTILRPRKSAAESPETEPGEEDDSLAEGGEPEDAREDEPTVKICPHCGKPLPEDF